MSLKQWSHVEYEKGSMFFSVAVEIMENNVISSFDFHQFRYFPNPAENNEQVAHIGTVNAIDHTSWIYIV